MPVAWQLQAAKNRLSEVIEDALREGPQTITRRGEPVAVVVSIEAWRKMTGQRPSLKELLRQAPLEELDLRREQRPARDVDLP